MTDLKIREVQLIDLEGINEVNSLIAIEGVHQLTKYSHEDLAVYISADNDCEFLVAVQEEKLLGYIEMRSYIYSKSKVMQLFVHPQERGKGIGSSLIECLQSVLQRKNKFPEIYLQVKEGNPSIKLYERYGFVKTKEVNGGIEMVCVDPALPSQGGCES